MQKVELVYTTGNWAACLHQPMLSKQITWNWLFVKSQTFTQSYTVLRKLIRFMMTKQHSIESTSTIGLKYDWVCLNNK